jgi:hypothetical protein
MAKHRVRGCVLEGNGSGYCQLGPARQHRRNKRPPGTAYLNIAFCLRKINSSCLLIIPAPSDENNHNMLSNDVNIALTVLKITTPIAVFVTMSGNLVFVIVMKPCYVGPLSPRHGASSGCGWRRRPPDMESSCVYTEQTVRDSGRGVVLQLVTKYHKGSRTWADSLVKRPKLRKLYLKRDTIGWYVLD